MTELPRASPIAGASTYLAAALILGIFVRALPLIGLDFPLGDGGMFAVMAEDLRSGDYRLPAFTSYNGGDIPFAYPPLGIYVLAIIPGNPVATEVWLPLLWSSLAILAFWALARAVFDDDAVGIATIAFALLPGANAWQIMGGGVTRGLEQVVSLLALASIARLLDAPGISRALVAVVFAGLAGLSHPVAPFAIVLGAVTLWAFRSRSRRGALWLVVVAGGSAAVMAPWLAAVVGQHGVQPFFAALETHVGVPERWVAVVVALILSTMVAWVALPISDELKLRVPFVVALLTVAVAGSVASRWVPGSVVYTVPPEVRQELTD